MTRAIGMAVLLAFVFALPCVHVCMAASADGDAIAALDICSPDYPGSTAGPTILVEPVFDVPVILAATNINDEISIIYVSEVVSPRVRPPVA